MLRKRLQDNSGSSKRIKLLDANTLLTPEKERVVKFDIKSDDIPKKLAFLTPPSTPTKKTSTVYGTAKALFQRGNKDINEELTCLKGREKEGRDINKFIHYTVGKNISDSLYVSGPPGCGKTAQLDLSLKQYSTCFNDDIVINLHKCKVIKINCMTIMKPSDIFNIILSKLGTQDSTITAYLNTKHENHSVLIVLDELDSLLTQNQAVLMELFQLSHRSNDTEFRTNFIIIGISNSIDLTNNLLHKFTKKPQTVNFKPYSFDKIKTIITNKLQSLIEGEKENVIEGFVPIVNTSAIMLCCKKVASATGDLRKAFDTIIESIEVLENELQQTDISTLNVFTAPRVQISHIAKVCNLNYNHSALTNLNNLQKTVIINMFNFEMENHRELNINNFSDYYNHHNENKIKIPEMLEILSTLDSIGVIRLCTNKVLGLTSINNKVNYKDLQKCIANNEFLAKRLRSVK